MEFNGKTIAFIVIAILATVGIALIVYFTTRKKKIEEDENSPYLILKYNTMYNRNTIVLPLTNIGTNGVTVDWGDGVIENFSSTESGNKTHIYTDKKDERFVTVKGQLLAFSHNNLNNNNLEKVISFGDLGLEDLSYAFANCVGLQSVSKFFPSTVTNTSYMFKNAVAFNSDIGGWNTSNVTNMCGMFYNTITFNFDISEWDTSKVTDVSYMFYNCVSFEQDIENWNTSNVANMSYMFYNNVIFKSSLQDWNTSKVTDMSYMFYNVINLSYIGNKWDVSNVVNMEFMFNGCIFFSENLGGWNIEKVFDMSQMLTNTGMTTEDYSNTLIGWATKNVQLGVVLDSSAKYNSSAIAARNTLINVKGWIINDGGLE